MSQKHVEIAAKLYQCRTSLLSLLGPDKFKAKLEDYRPIFAAAMKKHGCNEIQACIHMLQLLADNGNSGMSSLVVMAMCCELMEPSL